MHSNLTGWLVAGSQLINRKTAEIPKLSARRHVHEMINSEPRKPSADPQTFGHLSTKSSEQPLCASLHFVDCLFYIR